MKLPLYWEGLVYGKAMGWINLGKAGGSRMREFLQRRKFLVLELGRLRLLHTIDL